jgi:TetR/AcrR family transcriptional regulator, transcriptional repressor for nem operon
MPRPREFDSEQALQQATDLFWKKGFFETSVDDLVRCTGVGTYGLYSVYGDKKGLFLAALDKFRDKYVNQLLSQLEQPDASWPAITQYFSLVIDRAGTVEGRLGCLMCITSNQMIGLDAEVDKKVRQHFRRLKRAFHRAIANAAHKGEIKNNIDPEIYGDYLVGLAHGAASLLRSGNSTKSIRNFVTTGLGCFQPKY